MNVGAVTNGSFHFGWKFTGYDVPTAANGLIHLVLYNLLLDNRYFGTPEITIQNSSDTNSYKTMVSTVPIPGSSFYRLYRNGSLYREILSDCTQITDMDVLPGREYCYTMTTVCVLNGDTVESGYSNQVCKIVDCKEAPLLRASAEGKKVTLEWTHEAEQYDVYRNGECITSSNRLSTNNYVDAGVYLQEGIAYCYEVVAHCHTGDSLISNSICMTIDSCTVYTEWQAVVCEGETYQLHGFTVSEPGLYRQEFLTANFCDSIVTLRLTVHPVYHILITDDVCVGESYRLNGFDLPADSLQTSGEYMTERCLKTELECDSVITLHLTVHPSYHIILTDHICVEEVYQSNGFDLPVDSLPTSGSYVFNRMLATEFGCDSLVTLQLQVDTSIATEWAYTACDVYTWNEHTYETSGNYIQNFTSKQGCDSVVTLQLTVLNPVHVSFSDSVCGSYIWNDQTYTASGVYTQQFNAANGCDSVVILTLTVDPSYVVSFSDEICMGEPYQLNGFDLPADSLQTAGPYFFYQLLTTATGCDSLVTLDLQVMPNAFTELSEIVANQYTWNGQTYTESGDYIQTFTSAHGCDSTVIVHLTIVPVCETPGGLSATAEENRVRLNWTSSPVTLYYVLFRNGVEIENLVDTAFYIDAALEYATHYCYTLKAICEHGESEMSEEACVWTLPDGIDTFTDAVRIFPNPAHTIVSVEYNHLKYIRIYNSIGQLLETVNANGETGVDISVKNYSSGVYIFKIKTADGYEFSKRVVIEK